MITGLYTSLLALVLFALSLRVIALRGGPGLGWLAFGNDRDGLLQRAVRGHANLIEYAPIFILLMLAAELNDSNPLVLHSYGIIFVVARLMHGYCFGFLQHSMILRAGSTVVTLLSILGLAVVILINYWI